MFKCFRSNIYQFYKTKLRASNGFYIKTYDTPTNTGKTVYFNQIKYRFPSILLTQTTDDDEKK